VSAIEFYFLCGGEKIKTRSVGLSCRQKVCPMFDIYSCQFDILLSSLLVVVSVFTLAANGFGLGEGGDFHHKC
jgi:hypothetical protein